MTPTPPGGAAPSAVAATWETYSRLFAAAGLGETQVRRVATGCLTALAAWAPDLAEEVQATAQRAGLATWQAAALTARTEVLARAGTAGRGECSTVVDARPGRAPVGAQTWDWHRELAGSWTVREGAGELSFVTLTEHGILAKIGLNAAGVGVHLNILGHDSDGRGAGVPVHALARRILDTATSVEHAVTIAGSARVAASSCLTVLDGEAAAAVEVSPAGVRVLLQENGMVLHTNHFEDGWLARGDVRGPREPDTYDRLTLLRSRVADLPEGRDRRGPLVAALCAHADDGAEICCHPVDTAPLGQAWKTLATVVIEPVTGSFAVHRGGPCEAREAGWQVSVVQAMGNTPTGVRRASPPDA